MCNSTGSPIFSDFKSKLSRVARFLTAGQGNEDIRYQDGWTQSDCFNFGLFIDGSKSMV